MVSSPVRIVAHIRFGGKNISLAIRSVARNLRYLPDSCSIQSITKSTSERSIGRCTII
jgi:hypothetical protein